MLCIPVHPGRETSTHYFSCSGGSNTDSAKKTHRDTLRRTCVFASGGICESLSAFGWIWGMKHRCTIFHTRVSPVQIPEKSVSGHVTPNLCFHPVGYVGYVLHFGGSGAGNVDHYFSCLGRPSLDSTKSASGLFMPTLCFCIPWDMRFV
jgi:hypothetical protein